MPDLTVTQILSNWAHFLGTLGAVFGVLLMYCSFCALLVGAFFPKADEDEGGDQ
jgi:cytochrome bd-type quinol oxidase subunit 1